MTNNEDALLKAITRLNAEVTALNMIVKFLLVEFLLTAPDPKYAADEMANSVFKIEHEVSPSGDSAFAVLISDALTSLIDHAAQQAIAHREGKASEP